MKRFSSTKLAVTAVVVGVIALMVVIKMKDANASTRDITMGVCTTHMSATFHIHPNLTMRIDGVDQVLPSNIGITDTCMHPIHTHDATGKVHVEYERDLPFTLGDFLAIANETYDQEGFTTKMTVNGAESTERENLVLKDLDNIVIEYTSVNPPAEETTETTE